MSKTLVKGKYILCKANDEDAVDVISDGAVFQQDGEIIAVGYYDDLRADYTADEEIGSDKYAILPGLVNAHQHGEGVPYLLMGTRDDNLEPWLIRLKEHRPVDEYAFIMYCLARQIESGVTTVMHSHAPRSPDYEGEVTSILKAYRDSGIRVAFALGIRYQNNLVYQDNQIFLDSLPASLATRARDYLAASSVSEEDYFALFASLHNEYGVGPSRKIKILHGPLGPQWCPDELLMRIKNSAGQCNTGIHSHMLETIYQKIYAAKRFGKTIVEHLNDIGFLGPEVSLAHCVWVTDGDIQLLAQRGASVCHNPSSNLRLRSGIAPVNRMLQHGLNVALGMDSISINDDEDMLQELRLCAYLHRVPGSVKTGPSLGQLFDMATVNGAKATFFEDEIGTLEKGKRADMILVNLERLTEPYMAPETSIVDVILSRARSGDVDTVIIDGEIVLRHRRHTRINRDEIVARLKESLGRPLERRDIERRQLAQDLAPYVLQFYRHWREPEFKPYYLYNSAI